MKTYRALGSFCFYSYRCLRFYFKSSVCEPSILFPRNISKSTQEDTSLQILTPSPSLVRTYCRAFHLEVARTKIYQTSDIITQDRSLEPSTAATTPTTTRIIPARRRRIVSLLRAAVSWTRRCWRASVPCRGCRSWFRSGACGVQPLFTPQDYH